MTERIESPPGAGGPVGGPAKTYGAPGLAEPAHYRRGYDSKARLVSYWHQVDEALMLGGGSVLMVGHGSGLAALMLERAGLTVTTLDIDPDLHPTIIGDVRDMVDIEARSFDVALCCQVLEHLPFESFGPALKELRRVSRLGLVLSLPDQGRSSRLLAALLRRQDTAVSLPDFRRRVHVFNGQHYWQVNARGYPRRRIEAAIRKAGWTISTTYRPLANPYHRFWRLV
jgi:SAM-dependent methyltransferase